MDVRARFAPNGDWTFRALLDTGAPTTVPDRGVADALGIRIGRTGADTGRIKMLGGDGFFDRFVVTFNHYYGYVEVGLAADVEPPAPGDAPPGHDEPFYDPEWTRPTMY